jgi:hypothetical protein
MSLDDLREQLQVDQAIFGTDRDEIAGPDIDPEPTQEAAEEAKTEGDDVIPDVPVEALTGRRLRKRRRRQGPRKMTIPSRLMEANLCADALLYPSPRDDDRPRTRGDCANVPRPCPYTACRHHLFLDVNRETGSITLNFPHLEVDELVTSCSLDAADRDGLTLEAVGDVMNLTRERIRQIEVRALLKLKLQASGAGLDQALEAIDEMTPADVIW